MQLMDHMGDKSIKITWNWKDLEKVWKEQINTAADKLRKLIRPDALVVGVGSHPHIYPCLIEKEKHTPASPPYALFRADPLQICRGAHFFDIPYYVKQSNFSISLAARKYLASFAGACSNEKNQVKRGGGAGEKYCSRCLPPVHGSSSAFRSSLSTTRLALCRPSK